MSWRRSAATDQEVLALYAKMGSGRKVALAVGLSVPTVYGILDKHGIERSRSKPQHERRNGQVTDDQIVEAFQRLKSGIRVAETLNIGEATVYNTLKRRKIQTRGTDRTDQMAFGPEMTKELVRRYEDGLSIARIAEEVNVSAPTVWLYLRRAGVKTERRSSFRREQRETVRKMYLSHVPLIQIAKQIGSTEQSVRRFLRKEAADIWIEDAVRTKERATFWKGGRLTHRGYVYVYSDKTDPMHVMADKRGYIAEHRLVIARKLGRPLRASETVHHIDGNHGNNTLDNLQLRQGKHGKHVVMCCLDCGSHNIGHASLK